MEYRSTVYSKDGTIKYVFDIEKKGLLTPYKQTVGIESAFIQILGREDGKPEYVLCLSSQAGCVYKCMMCANMFSAFYGCLSPSEIEKQIELTLEQDDNLQKIRKKGTVEYAFMAMGEPLYGNNVISAIQKHQPRVDKTFFSLSTVGAKGTIDKLTRAELPFPVRLELSLHFSNDNERREWLKPDGWIFIPGKWPELTISAMLKEAENYAQKHPGKVTLNYALIDGVNNMDKNIEELSDLLKGKEALFYVKVMMPNLTSSMVFSWARERGVNKIKRYSPREFGQRLVEAGIPATLFESKGTDIGAGCGMMTTRFNDHRGKISADELYISQADPAKLGFE